MWQNILQLWEFKTDSKVRNGKTRYVLVPMRRHMIDRNACAAIFVKFGFDKDAYMPYDVYIHALTSAPARLLGHELILDNKRNGVQNNVDIAYLLGDAKVKCPKTRPGVFPPSGFDERLAERSQKLPRAHMWLEHVYGYSGATPNTIQSPRFSFHVFRTRLLLYGQKTRNLIILKRLYLNTNNTLAVTDGVRTTHRSQQHLQQLVLHHQHLH